MVNDDNYDQNDHIYPTCNSTIPYDGWYKDKRVSDTSNDLHRTSQPSHISHRLDTTSTQDNTGTSDWTLQECQKTDWTPQECQKDRLDPTGMSKGQTIARHHRNVKRTD